MGCKNSKTDINVHMSLDSRFFEDSLITCTKPINSPVQELFKEAKKKLKNKGECFDMKLCVGGKYIDSCSVLSLKQLGVYENSKVVIGVRTNTIKLKVLIQGETPTKASVSMKKDKTILNLKQKLMKCTKSDDLIVLFRNIALPDSTLIKQLNLEENEIITLIVKSENNLVATWKYKTPGFIIEGLCMNSECQGYRQRVCVPRGFGHFDISNEISNMQSCPCCGVTLSRIVGLGVAWCQYSAEFFQEQMPNRKEKVESFFDMPKDWNLQSIDVFALHSE
ncbi:hypothetical protein SteCoe_14343 [Stentor coeruleus]|uniref:Ubiquitin-like domain-containing protein n=1 Tax=Stentor coeruleus TaxID=5963 RepID=A0A1R2C693_9CILI|nr:hypothetical protein SteCoe_14343 [Stentor coeruleus]